MSEKPNLTPPPLVSPFTPDPAVARLKIIALVIFFLLALGAIGVVVLLPDRVEPPLEIQAITSKEGAAVPLQKEEASESEVVQARAKIEAEKLLAELLNQQAQLEADGVKIWGEQQLVTRYSEALAKLAEADGYFNRRQFDLSVAGYRQTLALFEQLASSRQNRLEQALQAGTAALERLDDAASKQAYQIALAIDPLNAIAQKGLRRGQYLRQVLERVEQGALLESRGELEGARAVYAEAVALDAEYAPARRDLLRVDALLLARNYRQAISKALLALEQQNYAVAQSSLARARQLQPGAVEVTEIERRLSAARQNERLERLRQQALQYEQSEKWKQAIATYDAALHIDKTAVFALDGRPHAKRFHELHQQLDYYLSQPERLQSEKPLTHAQSLLDVAASEAGSLLRSKADQLRQLITASKREVLVVLRSDEKTDVTLYRVGQMGRFSEHRLLLRPGSYTAVGIRAGYRDVRVTFTIPLSGSAAEMSILIRCEEPI